MKKIFGIILVITLLLISAIGCASVKNNLTSNISSNQNNSTAENTSVDTTNSKSENIIPEITDYSDAVKIVLGNTITIDGPGASVNGSTVNITAGGSYSISGKLTNGQINVNTTEKVYIELNEVNITNKSGPALFIDDAKKVTVTLASETTNYLTDAKSNNENDAAIFTNDTLVIEGEGTLIVTGNNTEGISSDDDIIINSGTIKVTAVDDGLNAHDDITINGGYVYIVSNGDGIDSNGTLNINGGTIISLGSTAGGDGGVDSTGIFTITGGTLIATGNSFAAPSDNSTQCSIYVNTGSTQVAKTFFNIEQDGKDIVTFAPERSYQNILYSSSSLNKDTTYEAYIGGKSSGESNDGLYSEGTYTTDINSTPISVTAAITPTGVGHMGGPGGMRGGPEGMREPGEDFPRVPR